MTYQDIKGAEWLNSLDNSVMVNLRGGASNQLLPGTNPIGYVATDPPGEGEEEETEGGEGEMDPGGSSRRDPMPDPPPGS